MTYFSKQEVACAIFIINHSIMTIIPWLDWGQIVFVCYSPGGGGRGNTIGSHGITEEKQTQIDLVVATISKKHLI